MATHVLRSVLSTKCSFCLKKHLNIFATTLSVRYKHRTPWRGWNNEGKVNFLVGDKTMTLSTGSIARFADGSASAQIGDTSVNVTAVSKEKTTPSPFLPLTVDYRQKAAAAGRIPTNHLRREMGVSPKEILVSRLIDRSIRPMFPQGFNADTQVFCNLLAVDGIHDPEVLSINAASAALALSNIPWNGPVGAVRVGCVDNEFVINPTRQQLQNSTLNLVVTGAENDNVVMLEGSAENVPHKDFAQAIKLGVKEAQTIINQIRLLQLKKGQEKREVIEEDSASQEIVDQIQSLAASEFYAVFKDKSHDKISRDETNKQIAEETLQKVSEIYPDTDPKLIKSAIDKSLKKVFRDLILDESVRCDGRSLNELRPIKCEVDLYKPLHGSALFTRGQTQVLGTLTFDSPDSAAKVDTITAIVDGIKEKNFFLHYEFPPYATNETGRVGFGRRELGHGALAEKSLRPVIPNNFPFTIRLTAEVLESNGSSSMASVCAGSLALRDAGVPINDAVAGVAIGLVTRSEPSTSAITKYTLLTDLLGIEDYFGDMDFKLAGTKYGVTGLQADIKLQGVPVNIITDAMWQGSDGIRQILKKMNATLPASRTPYKENRPVLETLTVSIAKRGKFLGLGGLNLKRITAETGVTITSMDEITYQLFAPNRNAMDEAKERIQDILTDEREPELVFGNIYQATIVELRENGIMVQLYPTMQPTLMSNKELDARRVDHPSALGLEVGQELSVKYLGRDDKTGKMRLSRRVLYMLGESRMRTLMKPRGGSKTGSSKS